MSEITTGSNVRFNLPIADDREYMVVQVINDMDGIIVELESWPSNQLARIDDVEIA